MQKNIEKKITAINWFLAHTRQLPLFTMDIGTYGYIKVSKKLFGWGFKNILIISEKGIEESYRDTKDDQRFLKYFSSHEVRKGKTIKKVSDDTAIRIKKLFRDLNNLSNSVSDKELAKLIGTVKETYGRLGAVLGITLPVGKYYEKKQQIIKAHDFAMVRKKQGELYPLMEKKLSRLFLLLSKKWKIESGLLLFLRADEIIYHLKSNSKPLKRELDSRRDFHIIFRFESKTFIITGDRANKLASKIRMKITAGMDKKRIINGTVAFKGNVNGIIRIVRIEKDLSKLKSKEIIVAPMTQVSFTHFLKKASAIITDEGGVTCHAAIISRELKIPCIIGTKIATKILKDGDLVEVDADKGIVKIVKK